MQGCVCAIEGWGIVRAQLTSLLQKLSYELFRILMVVIEARYIPNIRSVITHLESPREAFVRRQSDVAC